MSSFFHIVTILLSLRQRICDRECEGSFQHNAHFPPFNGCIFVLLGGSWQGFVEQLGSPPIYKAKKPHLEGVP